MPNLIDSLTIVKQFVFDERRCTMRELADALAADWKGHEKLLEEIRRERLVEFIDEGLRYNDIIRWKIAEKVLHFLYKLWYTSFCHVRPVRGPIRAKPPFQWNSSCAEPSPPAMGGRREGL